MNKPQCDTPTGCSVCINAGKFDIPLYESDSKRAAKIYFNLLTPLASAPVKLKRTQKVRKLKEYFITEDVPVNLTL